MVARVRKDDTVVAISGKDKGKQGTVIAISPKKGKVMVKGLAIKTRHVKARRQGEVSGIKKEEGYLDISKVMPVCSSCKAPTRVASKILDTGKRVRICNSCKEIF